MLGQMLYTSFSYSIFQDILIENSKIGVKIRYVE